MTDTPRRIQLSRAKGWRMPENTVKVTRPGMFGNPFGVRECQEILDLSENAARRQVVDWFRDWVDLPNDHERLDPLGCYSDTRVDHARLHKHLHTLRGKNLACWCKPGAPCHADVLLEIANRPVCEAAPSPPTSEQTDD